MATIDSFAEQQAHAATRLPAFNKLNLGGVKDEVEQVLRLIGTNGLFNEYSLHDISHVDRMLLLLETLVPVGGRECMAPADWLLLVLAVYFHDMGLLVTPEEFNARAESGFSDYCDERFAAGADGAEYQSKVKSLGTQADRFLYQEFIRENHAGRIADWIRGKADRQKGVSAAVAKSVADVLAPLTPEFREDLALICESHHLNDIDDTGKYQVAQPYGDSDSETANVQYAAVMLRTADLLHITQDRTPSTAFRLINPQNPISQREWAKQMAVIRVRPQLGRDEDGNFADGAPQDTMEVYAKFDDSDGFFGLTSYLRYAAGQLRQSYEWIRRSQERLATRHEFPWQRIDDTHVTAKGFLPQRLSFTLDQGRILELLTGHTLYNDTGVVIRELVQNAIDAVRLQTLIEKRSSSEGVVEVEWDGQTRELVVRDNGTGMTRSVVENNLLKAGASRYQEDAFLEKHGDFSAISRFGIGVLSAFMVADSVEVLTCAPEDAEATQLTLRSVHDRYLVRLIDKASEEGARLMPHGSEIRLKVRETAELPEVTAALKHWVVVPRCTVQVSVDGAVPQTVGAESCAKAVATALSEAGIDLYAGEGDVPNLAVRVVERVVGGVELAFAVRWNSFFREWAVLRANGLSAEAVFPASGACIEGIRVEQPSAGFTGMCVVGLCNATGHDAPKTNVARSGLEATSQRTVMMRHVYDGYVDHVAKELKELTERGFSSTWAAQEADILLQPFFDNSRNGDAAPMEPRALSEAVASKRLMIVEDGDGRRLASAVELGGEQRLWTTDSAFVRAGESLLREIPNDASLAALSSALGSEAVSLPDGVTLVGYDASSMLYQPALVGRQVSHVEIRRSQRRIDLAWELTDDEPAWLNLSRSRSITHRSAVLQGVRATLLIALKNPAIEGRQGEVAVRAHGQLLVFADSPIAEYLRDVWPALPDGGLGTAPHDFIGVCVEDYFRRWQPPEDMRAHIDALLNRMRTRTTRADLVMLDEHLDLDGLAKALEDTPLMAFDPSAWRRGGDLSFEE
jgi:molecular chaperone HtpG